MHQYARNKESENVRFLGLCCQKLSLMCDAEKCECKKSLVQNFMDARTIQK